jgi:hypothetical protein
MYAKINNGQVEKYPYSIGQLRKDNPSTSFPRNPSTETLESYGVFAVYDTPIPSYDEYTHSVDEFPPVYNQAESRWERSWAVRTATDQEIAVRKNSLMLEITNDTQHRLDDFAQGRGYDNMLSACTYASSPTPKFAAEGAYCLQQRDATWAVLYSILAEVEAGTREMPRSFADVEGDLPELVWPN